MVRHWPVRIGKALSIACCAWIIGGGHAFGQGSFLKMATSVELYTSSGCSACPSADIFFRDHVARIPGVLPLAFHVDYWDYLGWKDEFAQRAFSERQRSYADENEMMMIYTPQIVIGGTEFLVGHDRRVIKQLIEQQFWRSASIPVKVTYEGGEVVISATDHAPANQFFTAYLIRYLDSNREVNIGAGENANLKITYSNIVDSLERAGTLKGPNFKEIRVKALPIDDRETAVIIHEGRVGKVIWAGKLLE